MPYKIVPENGKFAVRKEKDNELVAMHDTHEQAQRQIEAIAIHEDSRPWTHRRLW